MPLTPEQKAERKRQRMLDKARQYQRSTYMRKFVAPVFQKMIRSEFAAKPEGHEKAVVDGQIEHVWRAVGECVCVTCGSVNAWNSGIKGMHTGHFVPSRRNSVLLEEKNVAPQCAHCNYYGQGAPAAFHLWMHEVRGQATIDYLRVLKTLSQSFTVEELVDKRIQFAERLKAAEDSMKGVDVEF